MGEGGKLSEECRGTGEVMDVKVIFLYFLQLCQGLFQTLH